MCATLSCKNMCRASRFCTGGGGGRGSKSKTLHKGAVKQMLAREEIDRGNLNRALLIRF